MTIPAPDISYVVRSKKGTDVCISNDIELATKRLHKLRSQGSNVTLHKRTITYELLE
jgi:hypothetical protein